MLALVHGRRRCESVACGEGPRRACPRDRVEEREGIEGKERGLPGRELRGSGKQVDPCYPREDNPGCMRDPREWPPSCAPSPGWQHSPAGAWCWSYCVGISIPMMVLFWCVRRGLARDTLQAVCTISTVIVSLQCTLRQHVAI